MTFSTRELEPGTWEDFERLFSPGTGWGFCACMLYQRGCHLASRAYPTRALALVENHREKRELVDAGKAHGVLVYEGDDPIGWCQFGPAEELPLPGAVRLDRRMPPLAPDVEWRVTCFVTAAGHRRRGVAGVALRAALSSISHRGGGLVEAYPTTTPEDSDWQHAGTVALFEGEGFSIHRRPAGPYVIMRRSVEATASRQLDAGRR